MRCDQVQERLSEYLENRLDAENHTSVHDHLSSCPHCQAEAQGLAQTLQAVADLPIVEPPPGFSQRVMASIREEAARPNLWQRLFLPFMIKIPIHAMAILLVGGFAVYLYQANKPVQTEVAKLAPTEPQTALEKDLFSQTPAAPPPPEQGSKMMDEASPPDPGRVQDLKQEGLPAHIPLAPTPVQTADHQLTFVPKGPAEKGTVLAQKVGDLVKKMGGQYVRSEEVVARAKQGLATAPHQGGATKTQILWLLIPQDRYGQFKTELAALGMVQEMGIAPEMPAGSMAAPKPSTEGLSPLRIKLVLQLTENPR
jgi:hypothetical protein